MSSPFPRRAVLATLLIGALAAAAQQPVPTLRLSARRVVLDVTVTDSAGHPVPNLTAGNFRVTEDKTPQTLRNFEVHTASPQPPSEPIHLPPNTFSNFTAGPTGAPITVILYDVLNTPLDAQPYAHAQLLAFLKQRRPSTQVAVFVLSDKLHMLQGFTDDDNKLIAALDSKQAHTRSALLRSGQEASATSNSLARTDGNQNGADARQDDSFHDLAGMLANMETTEQSYLLDRRVDLTAQALQQIARFLAALPGRKSLLWLSGGFPSGILPNADADGRDTITSTNEFRVTRNYGASIVQATDLLNSSHVAVYPIDARGLQTNPMFSAAGNQTFEPGQGKDTKAVRDFTTTLAGEHSTMDVIAGQTGGRAFYNTNGLKQAALDAIQDSSLYYTLTYSPTNPAADGKLRHVRIELTHPGYQLTYRRSYFALAGAPPPASPADPVRPALEHGTPPAHDLIFEAHVTAVGAPAPATPQQMQELLKSEALFSTSKRVLDREARTPLLLQPYVVQYVLIPRQLTLPLGPDGNRRDSLELDAVAFNQDGQLLSGTRTAIQDVIRPDRWALMQEGGYHLPISILVPTTATSLRLAIRDAANDHLGSLELPLPIPQEPTAP